MDLKIQFVNLSFNSRFPQWLLTFSGFVKVRNPDHRVGHLLWLRILLTGENEQLGHQNCISSTTSSFSENVNDDERAGNDDRADHVRRQPHGRFSHVHFHKRDVAERQQTSDTEAPDDGHRRDKQGVSDDANGSQDHVVGLADLGDYFEPRCDPQDAMQRAGTLREVSEVLKDRQVCWYLAQG